LRQHHEIEEKNMCQPQTDPPVTPQERQGIESLDRRCLDEQIQRESKKRTGIYWKGKTGKRDQHEPDFQGPTNWEKKRRIRAKNLEII
jgi:hypothetical protein